MQLLYLKRNNILPSLLFVLFMVFFLIGLNVDNSTANCTGGITNGEHLKFVKFQNISRFKGKYYSELCSIFLFSYLVEVDLLSVPEEGLNNP